MRRCNCLFWALGQWLRRGGYVAVVWSRRHPYTHWFHADDLTGPWRSYKPLKKSSFVLWFRGRIEEGD